MKFRNKIFIIALMMIFLSISAVSAAQEDVALTNQTDDELTIEDSLQSESLDEGLSSNDGDVLGEIGHYAELNQAFLDNDKFTFEKDYEAIGTDQNHINIMRTIEINGNGHYIDAKGLKGIFQIDSSKSDDIYVTIKNLVFKNGIRDNGAALYVTSADNVYINIINCQFIGHESNKEGSAIYFDSSGGNLIVKDSTFERCYSQKSTSNDRGGTICMMDGHLNIEGSTFAYIESKGQGGAIYAETTIEVNDCFFNQCRAYEKSGGAIYYNKREDVWIKNSKFYMCKSGDDGGAVYINRNYDSYFIDCTFEYNSIDSNDYVVSGGAIFNDGSGKLFLVHSKFMHNDAYSNYNPAGTFFKNYKGGAICSEYDIDVIGCYFERNYAKDHGGAIYTDGGIYWGDEGSVFISNFVRTDTNIRFSSTKGGAIYAGYFKNTAKNMVFSENRAGCGGAIYLNNKHDYTFESCYFDSNYAKRYTGTSYGGAIYVDSAGSDLYLIGNYFNNNNADEGLCIYNCGVYKTVTNNWWGSNNPDFDKGFLIQWRKIPFPNLKISDSDHLKMVLTAEIKDPLKSTRGNLTVKLVDKNGNDFAKKIPNLVVYFTSYTTYLDSEKVDGGATSTGFTPKWAGNHTFQAQFSFWFNPEFATCSLFVDGDFNYLQQAVEQAENVLNLERDFTYSEGVDTIVEGIKIEKALIINGNGHTIDAKGKSRIFDITSNHVEIRNVTLINGDAPNTVSEGGYSNDGSAIRLTNAGYFNITDCIIRNNYAGHYGGAIYSNEASRFIQIINCSFENNRADYWGGVIYTDAPDAKIINSRFTNNTAKYGAAIYVDERASTTLVDKSTFINNVGSYDGAIHWYSLKGHISNSLFLSNKAEIHNFLLNTTEEILTVTVESWQNYMNAIYLKPGEALTLTNVTYWNGEVVTGDNPLNSIRASGQNITIELFKKNETGGDATLAGNITLVTDIGGQIKYNYTGLEDGNYMFKAYHMDDGYYNAREATGEFTVMHLAPNPSSVNITTTNGIEFEYEKVRIEFSVENETEIRIFVTNLNGTRSFYDYSTTNKYFGLILPASDEYYNITVYNIGNETYRLSKDSILFKVVKTDSHIQIESLPEDIRYPSDAVIRFEGSLDCHDYNVTVYDENNNPVFSQILWVSQTYGSMKMPILNTGNYTINVTNLGNNNRKENTASAKFRVFKTTNNFAVSVDASVYGRNVTVAVNADIDGEYAVKINDTIITVNVTNGTGIKSIELGAGYYTANVTFDDKNYDNNATNTVFTIEKAQSNVDIGDLGNVSIAKNITVYLNDDYPALYNVTIYNGTNIIYAAIISNITFELPKLDVGQYNLTVANWGNDNITGSSDSLIFDVDNINVVDILVFDNDYGRDVTIYLFADVDGTYEVDINGTKLEMEVEDGWGFYEDNLDLNAGEYSANVTFANTDYKNMINNCTFTIFKAMSNVNIEEIGSVAYGEKVIIKFNDPYSVRYYALVWNSEGEVEFEVMVSFDGSKNMTVEIENFPVGEYTVSIENLGDENVEGSIDYATFNVTGARIIATDMTRGFNSGEDFKATLVDENKTPIANAKVTFTINGKNYTAVTDANGLAVINQKLAVGTYDVIIINPINNAITAKNLKIVTRITGNKNVNTYYGKNYQYKLRIIGDDGNPVGVGVAVKVTVNGKAQTLKTDKNGYIAVKFTKAYLSKIYTVIAEYKGIKVSNKVVVKKVLTLKKVKVKKSAKKLTLTATLKEGKKAIKGKKLIFKFKGKKYTAKTNKKGVAKVTIKSKVLKKLKAGKKVTYQVTYLKNTVKRTVKVKR